MRIRKYIPVLIFALLSFLIIELGIGFKSDISLSSDGFFHLGRFEYLYDNVKSLNFFNDFYTHDYMMEMGYPLGIFYPQATLYPFVVLSLLLGLSSVTGFKLMLVLTVFLSLLSFYLAFQAYYKDAEFIKNIKLLAFFGALIYIFTPLVIPIDESIFRYMSYFFNNTFIRNAVGESLTYIMFPWIIVGLKKIVSDKPDGKILLISMLGILYTHVLSGIFAGLIAVFFYICHWRKIIHNALIWKETLKTIILFLLIGAYQIFPMLEMMMFQDYGYNVPFFYKNTLFNMANKVTPSALSQVTLPVQLLTGITLVLALWKAKGSKWRFLVLSMIGTYISSKLFPWQYLDNSFLSIIQFPFRASFLFSLFIAFGIPVFLDRLSSRLSVMLLSLMVVVNIAAASHTPLVYLTPKTDFDRHHPHTLMIGAGAEYLPSNFDTEDLERETGFTFSYTLMKMSKLYEKALSDDFLIAKFYHKGYVILDNGKEVQFRRGYSGLIETDIPLKESELVIYRERSFIQNATFIITILTIIIQIIIMWRKRKV